MKIIYQDDDDNKNHVPDGPTINGTIIKRHNQDEYTITFGHNCTEKINLTKMIKNGLATIITDPRQKNRDIIQKHLQTLAKTSRPHTVRHPRKNGMVRQPLKNGVVRSPPQKGRNLSRNGSAADGSNSYWHAS